MLPLCSEERAKATLGQSWRDRVLLWLAYQRSSSHAGVIKYGLVVLFNVTMWGFYVNSPKALSSLQAIVTNFATNFLSSGLSRLFLFKEPLSFQWFAGALFIVVGVLILSKSSMEKESID